MSDDSKQWEGRDFTRRSYAIQGDDLDSAKTLRVVVQIDGKTIAQLQCREPGMIAVVSRPDDQGIDLELVQPGGVRFTDLQTPGGERTTLALPAGAK